MKSVLGAQLKHGVKSQVLGSSCLVESHVGNRRWAVNAAGGRQQSYLGLLASVG